MLRHFEYINDQARDCLIQRGYTHEAIDKGLAIPGSKFHRVFATDLKTLCENLEENMFINPNERGKYLEYSFHFKLEEYPEGIGKKGIVPLKEIENDPSVKIIQKFNRGILLNHAIVKTIPNEWDITVVIKPQRNYNLLITAFPGTITMPVPKKDMNKIDWELSSKYWEQHCFLELFSS
jgi:hypothetical protein